MANGIGHLAGDGDAPVLPPLLTGIAVPAERDPFAAAVAAAQVGGDPGGDPGSLFWSQRIDAMQGALVLAPETSLRAAMAMVFAAALGMGDSLGALAPPEVGLSYVWPDRFKVNGAWCGGLRVAAPAGAIPDAEPDWLVVGVTLPLLPVETGEPGEYIDRTVLHEEGCTDLSPVALVGAWGRHMLVWINRWLDDGPAPLLAAWMERADGRGDILALDYAGVRYGGRFEGLDPDGNMLLAGEAGMQCLPLLAMLEQAGDSR